VSRAGAVLLLAVVGLAPAPRAAADPASDDATGDWGGARRSLEDHGVHLDLDYTAEVFTLPGDSTAAYRGDVDAMATLDTEKLGLWACGSLFVYGQSAHGHGVSGDFAPLMPVSNLEAPRFTQLSELWLAQCLGSERLVVRLGKQDANRDFAAPRFGGNFLNSSYGVIPTAPMPSFPTPGLGAALFGTLTDWLELRGAVYEGAPTIRSFGEDAAEEGAGVFAVAQLVLRHDLFGQPSGQHAIGAWTHTGQERSGLFAVVDWFVRLHPDDANDARAFQLFARGGWSERSDAAPGAIDAYVGGGFTAHGFLGANHTVGVGAASARAASVRESFVELFCKLRFVPWLTLEPEAQLYFTDAGEKLALGMRAKLKL
jgi:carbohydrate-selective porin OprB